MEANNAALDRGRAQEENTALNHAWDWFKYHADQRLMLIRYYLIMVGALGGGYLAALKDGLYAISIVVAIFGAVVSVLFERLDQRVSDLVKVGEAAMAKEEEALARRTGYDEIKIVERADIGAHKSLGSFRKIFRVMFRTAFLGFTIAAIVAGYGAWRASSHLLLATGISG